MGEDSPLQFPCRFPIKVMGPTRPGFSEEVCRLVRAQAPDLGDADVRCRASSGGRYLSVTVTINAQSRAQLDAIYQALTAWEGSSFVL
ncbi:DUF493 domain-containing protein [Ectothiorhodospiraceae bacterium 2226]|nr:DUF493 domain-containing protein [Ectothiorhodospiraceae bacterium 2226]